MELAGNEKRIQALFSELSLEDQSHAPRFDKLWRAGESTFRTPRFSRSLVALAASVLLAVAGLVVAWTQYTRTEAPIERNVQNVTPQPIPVTSPSPETQSQKLAAVPRRARSHSHRLVARQKQIDRALQQQAALLANWQSPTDEFMTSPAASVFKSLPQLNQSAKDLESFLPKNVESLKESNR
jgi:cell division protein FtsN